MWCSSPKIRYRWYRTVNTKSDRIKLIPSFSQDRCIVLTWDKKNLLYLSQPVSTPCGRHGAQLLIDGELHPCDSFNVASPMFRVDIYTKDSSSDEDEVVSTPFCIRSSVKVKKPNDHLSTLKKTMPLSLSQDSGIQEMNPDIPRYKNMETQEEKDEHVTDSHFADVDEFLDKMRAPITVNWNLNRSQSLGSITQLCGSCSAEPPRSSTPIHRSVEKLVIVMPADMDEDVGKKKYLKKCVQIERNLDCSMTTIEKSVAVVKNMTEICRGSERVVEIGPEIVGLESLRNVITTELKDEESQTGDIDEEQFVDVDKSVDDGKLEIGEDLIDDGDVGDQEIDEDKNEDQEIDDEKSGVDETLADDQQVVDVEESVDDEQIEDEEEIVENLKPVEDVMVRRLSYDLGDEEENVENDEISRVSDEAEKSSSGISMEIPEPKIEILEDEIETSSKFDDETENSIESMKNRIEAREEQVRQLEEEISLIDKSRESLRQENLELVEQEMMLTDEISNTDERLTLTKEVDKLKSQVDKQEQANAMLEWEVKTLRSRLDSNDPTEVAQLIEEMRVLRDELVSLTGKNKDLFVEIVDLREENTNLKKNVPLDGEFSNVAIATDHSSTSDDTEYQEIPVDGTRSFGVQTEVSALESDGGCGCKGKRRQKVKKKKKKKTVTYDDSGSSTDSLIEKADNLFHHSISEFIDHPSNKHHHKITRTKSSSVHFNKPTTSSDAINVKRTCRILSNLSPPFIPKSHLDISLGFRVKFIHPVNLLVMEGLVRFIGPLVLNPSVVHVGVELDRPVGDCDGSVNGVFHFKCENNHGVFIPMRKVILVWKR